MKVRIELEDTGEVLEYTDVRSYEVHSIRLSGMITELTNIELHYDDESSCEGCVSLCTRLVVYDLRSIEVYGSSDTVIMKAKYKMDFVE